MNPAVEGVKAPQLSSAEMGLCSCANATQNLYKLPKSMPTLELPSAGTIPLGEDIHPTRRSCPLTQTSLFLVYQYLL